MADIFISYSREDRDLTADLARALTSEGYSIWWDQKLIAGEEFNKSVERELEAAKAVIVIWSANSVDSAWVREEVDFANRENKLIPVFDDSIEPSKLPHPFRMTNSIPLSDRSQLLKLLDQRVRPGSAIDKVVEKLSVTGENRERQAWQANQFFLKAWGERGRSAKAKSKAANTASPDSKFSWPNRLGATNLGLQLQLAFDPSSLMKWSSLTSVELLADILPQKLQSAERQLVIKYGETDPRLSLVLLMPSREWQSSGTLVEIGKIATGEALENGFFKTKERLQTLYSSRKNASRRNLSKLLKVINAVEETAFSASRPEIAKQAALLLWTTQPSLVVFPSPKMKLLCVPCPNLDIEGPDERQSTVGAVVYDAAGQMGVTAAYHATGPAGTKVAVGATESAVALASEVQDTVFVPLPDSVNLPELKASGVMKRPPWDEEDVWFWGRTSQRRSTVVIGHDRGINYVRAGRQLCVQTRPDTEEGDSGAGLVNGEGKLIGFAFQRTQYGMAQQFSDWIWAASAISELKLKLKV